MNRRSDMSRLRIAAAAATLTLLALAGCNGFKLSDIAQAACAAQSAANLAGEISLRQGNLTLAAHFAEASRLAGLACGGW